MKTQVSNAISDSITQAIDTILILPDPSDRLEAFVYLLTLMKIRGQRERNRAAYQARLDETGDDIALHTGINRADAYRWAVLHAHSASLPIPSRVNPTDVSGAVTIASAALDDR